MSKYSTKVKCHFPSRHVGWRNNSGSFSFGVSLHLGGDLVQPYLIFNISWKHCPGCMAECTVKSWAGPWFVIKIMCIANKQVQMNLISKRRINRSVFSQSLKWENASSCLSCSLGLIEFLTNLPLLLIAAQSNIPESLFIPLLSK